MYRIAVIGDYDSIYGFATLGIDIFAVTAENGRETFQKIAKGYYKVIYMTEALAIELEEEIQKYAEEVTPAIILIPGVACNTGDGIQSVKDSVEKAVGSDILFGEE